LRDIIRLGQEKDNNLLVSHIARVNGSDLHYQKFAAMQKFALGRPRARRAEAVADCFSAMEGSGRCRHFAAAKDLLDRLGRLRPETRARWGKMNAHQMVCHLNDSFGAAMGDRTTSKDITFLSRTLIKWIALYAPLPWPKGVPTRPEVDQLDRGTRPVEFWFCRK
jgi:hypothetical protein